MNVKPSEKLIELGYVDNNELPIYNELDKQFIDKNKLKLEILHILENARTNACIKAFNDKDYLIIYEKNVKKNILKLLEE